MNHRLVLGTFAFFILSAQVFASDAVTLRDVLTITFKFNPVLAQRMRESAAANAMVDAAKWNYFPSMSANVQESDQDTSTSSALIKQPLWTGGRIESQLDSANAEFSKNIAAQHETEQKVASEVVSAYVAVIKLQALYQAAQENEQTHADLHAVIERRAKAEVSPTIDRTLSEARLELARIETIRVKSELQSAINKLEELAGADYSEAQFSIPSVSNDMHLKDLIDSGYQRSPVKARLQSEIDIASAELDYQKSQLLPELSINYQRRFGDIYTGQNEEEVFLALTLDTGPGFSKSDAITSQSYEREAVKEQLNAFYQEFKRDVSDRWVAINRLRRSQKPLQEASDAAKEIVASYKRQFQVGKKSWLDVLNAQRERNQSLVALIENEHTLAERKIDLLILTGQFDLPSIN